MATRPMDDPPPSPASLIIDLLLELLLRVELPRIELLRIESLRVELLRVELLRVEYTVGRITEGRNTEGRMHCRSNALRIELTFTLKKIYIY